jgi:hypothetical protein
VLLPLRCCICLQRHHSCQDAQNFYRNIENGSNQGKGEMNLTEEKRNRAVLLSCRRALTRRHDSSTIIHIT